MVNKRALSLSLLAILAAGVPAAAQSTAGTRQTDRKIDRASAYYHYSLGHLYAELAGAYGNKGDYATRAIENFRLAMKADPRATFVADELSDFYIQSGRLREGVTEAEKALEQNPDDLNSRRILGRIYTRLIGDARSNSIDETMLKRAIEQYQKITEKDAKDAEAWLMLGRLQRIAQNSVESEQAYKKVLEINPDSEDALTGLAEVYVGLGDNKTATELLRKVAEKNPSLRSLTTLASAYEQMREYSLAAETLKTALKLAPNNAELKRALAQNLLLADQVDASLALYNALVQEDPKDVQSHLRISQIFRQQRQFAKAREAADKAKALDPNNLEIRYNDVNLLEAEGKDAEAIALMRDIVNSTAKRSYSTAERSYRVMLLERLATMYRGSEQYTKAIELFRQVAEVDPDLSPRASAQIIETYRAARDFVRAEQEADAAAKKYPNDRTLRLVRSSLLAEIGKGDQAIAEMKKLLDGKNDRETYLSLAQLYDKTKNYDEMAKAIDASEKLATTKEDRESTHFMRGAMLEKLKKYDAAEGEFRKVLEINPDSASAMNYLGYMLADRNVRLQEAHTLITKALEYEPHNGAYLDSLGWVLYRMDKLPEAEELLLRALERAKRDPAIHDHLGDVYFRQGRLKEAIVQWESALQAWETAARSEVDRAEVAKVQKKLESAKVRLAKEAAPASSPVKPQ
jgi:tetratricopeptide (TPR) repeat protein